MSDWRGDSAGPVWHASVAGRVALRVAEQFRIAERQLEGVGDAWIGEWREVGDRAVHLRRRLTAREMAEARIAAVVDVRRTAEHATRIAKMRPFLPAAMQTWPDTAFP